MGSFVETIYILGIIIIEVDKGRINGIYEYMFRAGSVLNCMLDYIQHALFTITQHNITHTTYTEHTLYNRMHDLNW